MAYSSSSDSVQSSSRQCNFKLTDAAQTTIRCHFNFLNFPNEPTQSFCGIVFQNLYPRIRALRTSRTCPALSLTLDSRRYIITFTYFKDVMQHSALNVIPLVFRVSVVRLGPAAPLITTATALALSAPSQTPGDPELPTPHLGDLSAQPPDPHLAQPQASAQPQTTTQPQTTAQLPTRNFVQPLSVQHPRPPTQGTKQSSKTKKAAQAVPVRDFILKRSGCSIMELSQHTDFFKRPILHAGTGNTTECPAAPPSQDTDSDDMYLDASALTPPGLVPADSLDNDTHHPELQLLAGHHSIDDDSDTLCPRPDSQGSLVQWGTVQDSAESFLPNTLIDTLEEATSAYSPCTD